MAKYGFNPDWAVPPGRTLKELCDHEASGTLESRISRHLGVSDLFRFFVGEEPITEEVAVVFWSLTGVSMQFWLNAEKNYRDALARGAKVA